MTAFVLMTALLCSGAKACGTIAVVAVPIGHGNTIKGCVFASPNGLRLRASDSKIYTIEGDTANIKVGDKVKLHGSREERTKGSTKDSSRDQVFIVEAIKKDYGPCDATPAGETKPRSNDIPQPQPQPPPLPQPGPRPK
jgi:hypothetical protein